MMINTSTAKRRTHLAFITAQALVYLAIIILYWATPNDQITQCYMATVFFIIPTALAIFTTITAAANYAMKWKIAAAFLYVGYAFVYNLCTIMFIGGVFMPENILGGMWPLYFFTNAMALLAGLVIYGIREFCTKKLQGASLKSGQ